MNHKGAPAFPFSFFFFCLKVLACDFFLPGNEVLLLEITVRLQSATGLGFNEKEFVAPSKHSSYNDDTTGQKYLALSWNGILIRCRKMR